MSVSAGLLTFGVRELTSERRPRGLQEPAIAPAYDDLDRVTKMTLVLGRGELGMDVRRGVFGGLPRALTLRGYELPVCSVAFRSFSFSAMMMKAHIEENHLKRGDVAG